MSNYNYIFVMNGERKNWHKPRVRNAAAGPVEARAAVVHFVPVLQAVVFATLGTRERNHLHKHTTQLLDSWID